MTIHERILSSPPRPMERETYAEGFLRLMDLRASIERTLREMAELLDDAPGARAEPALAAMEVAR